ncbi:MAG: type II toxin-antitoxin system VapC family toxin [Candidatus Dormibacteria bacterium]
MSALVLDVHSGRAVATAERPLVHLISTLAYAETVAAIGRAQALRRLDARRAKAARRLLQHGPWRRLMLQPDWGVITTIAERSRLRGADLWHLASVSTLTRQLPEVRLLSFDERLIAAAAALGLGL